MSADVRATRHRRAARQAGQALAVAGAVVSVFHGSVR